jgi:hypothetical protein
MNTTAEFIKKYGHSGKPVVCDIRPAENVRKMLHEVWQRARIGAVRRQALSAFRVDHHWSYRELMRQSADTQPTRRDTRWVPRRLRLCVTLLSC